jgi:hypothetical protein
MHATLLPFFTAVRLKSKLYSQSLQRHGSLATHSTRVDHAHSQKLSTLDELVSTLTI